MNLKNLEKLLLCAKKASNHTEFVILGSLAALGVRQKLPERMATSIDVDMYIKNDPGRTEALVKELGEGSIFESENGFYLDAVSPKLPSFPDGWEGRLIPVPMTNNVVAYFVDINDVAISKYIRGEARDREWISAGIISGILDLGIIKERIGTAMTLDGELEKARELIAEDELTLTLGASSANAKMRR